MASKRMSISALLSSDSPSTSTASRQPPTPTQDHEFKQQPQQQHQQQHGSEPPHKRARHNSYSQKNIESYQAYPYASQQSQTRFTAPGWEGELQQRAMIERDHEERWRTQGDDHKSISAIGGNIGESRVSVLTREEARPTAQMSTLSHLATSALPPPQFRHRDVPQQSSSSFEKYGEGERGPPLHQSQIPHSHPPSPPHPHSAQQYQHQYPHFQQYSNSLQVQPQHNLQYTPHPRDRPSPTTYASHASPHNVKPMVFPLSGVLPRGDLQKMSPTHRDPHGDRGLVVGSSTQRIVVGSPTQMVLDPSSVMGGRSPPTHGGITESPKQRASGPSSGVGNEKASPMQRGPVLTPYAEKLSPTHRGPAPDYQRSSGIETHRSVGMDLPKGPGMGTQSGMEMQTQRESAISPTQRGLRTVERGRDMETAWREQQQHEAFREQRHAMLKEQQQAALREQVMREAMERDMHSHEREREQHLQSEALDQRLQGARDQRAQRLTREQHLQDAREQQRHLQEAREQLIQGREQHLQELERERERDQFYMQHLHQQQSQHAQHHLRHNHLPHHHTQQHPSQQNPLPAQHSRRSQHPVVHPQQHLQTLQPLQMGPPSQPSALQYSPHSNIHSPHPNTHSPHLNAQSPRSNQQPHYPTLPQTQWPPYPIPFRPLSPGRAPGSSNEVSDLRRELELRSGDQGRVGMAGTERRRETVVEQGHRTEMEKPSRRRRVSAPGCDTGLMAEKERKIGKSVSSGSVEREKPLSSRSAEHLPQEREKERSGSSRNADLSSSEFAHPRRMSLGDISPTPRTIETRLTSHLVEHRLPSSHVEIRLSSRVEASPRPEMEKPSSPSPATSHSIIELHEARWVQEEKTDRVVSPNDVQCEQVKCQVTSPTPTDTHSHCDQPELNNSSQLRPLSLPSLSHPKVEQSPSPISQALTLVQVPPSASPVSAGGVSVLANSQVSMPTTHEIHSIWEHRSETVTAEKDARRRSDVNEHLQMMDVNVKETAHRIDMDDPPRYNTINLPEMKIEGSTTVVDEHDLQSGNGVDDPSQVSESGPQLSYHAAKPKPPHCALENDLTGPAPTSESDPCPSNLEGHSMHRNSTHPEVQPQWPPAPPRLAAPIPPVLQLRPSQTGENKSSEKAQPKAVLTEHDGSLDDELLSLVDDIKPKTEQTTTLPPPPLPKKTPASGTVTPAKAKPKPRASVKATKATKTSSRPDSAAPSPPPISSKALKSKTKAAAGSRKKSMNARAMSAKPEPTPDPQQGERLYCLCKKPYEEDKVMIACDRCDEWYHPACVNMPEVEVDLVDMFICEKCVTKNPASKTTYKTRCYRGTHHISARDEKPECWRPARGTFSKYCSDSCGMAHMRAKIALLGHDVSELWPVVRTAKKREGVTIEHTVSKKMKLEKEERMDIVLDVGQPKSISNRTPAEARELESLQERLTSVILKREENKLALELVAARRRLLDLAVERASGRFCGWDARLEMGDVEWAEWIGTDAGKKALEGEEDDNDGEEDGVGDWWCHGPEQCPRHTGWQTVRDADAQREVNSKNSSIKQLTDKERELRRRIEDLDPPAHVSMKGSKNRKRLTQHKKNTR